MKNKILMIVIILIGFISTIFPQTLFRNAIFLNRSVGNHIWQHAGASTDVPTEITAYNSVHGYTGSDAVSMVKHYPFPAITDNEWYRWHTVWNGAAGADSDSLYKYLNSTTYDIIIMKTCYPASDIFEIRDPCPDTTARYAQRDIGVYKWHLRSIVKIMEAHPDKFFSIWTLIPQYAYQDPNSAGYALWFSTWMKDTLATGLDVTYGAFPDNVYIFDYFRKIADGTGHAPLQYVDGPGDDHPSAAASELIAPQFVQEIFDAAITYEIGGIATFQLSVPIQNEWNLVSIPGLHPLNQNVSTWWAFRDPGASVFKYAGGYLAVTVATPGIGYWMKHSGARTYNTGDEWPAGGIQVVAHHPINGEAGWNLIGGYELSVATANITTVPPGLQSGTIYKYVGGYQIANTLDPGYGYWIKLTGAGQIIIPEVLAKGEKPVEYFPEQWGKIVLTDATGVNYTLYSVKGETDLSQYELPPVPMAGMFDIRYRSGRIAEDLSSSQLIEVNGITYPCKVRVENMSISLQDESGKEINVQLQPGDQYTISNNTINKLLVLSSELVPPIEYTLEQNYPNPFNPSTTIRYNLPEAGNVKLTIYDILGQEIRTLVNEYKESGVYTINFDARELNSGMYIYKLEVNGFIQTRKMTLVK